MKPTDIDIITKDIHRIYNELNLEKYRSFLENNQFPKLSNVLEVLLDLFGKTVRNEELSEVEVLEGLDTLLNEGNVFYSGAINESSIIPENLRIDNPCSLIIERIVNSFKSEGNVVDISAVFYIELEDFIYSKLAELVAKSDSFQSIEIFEWIFTNYSYKSNAFWQSWYNTLAPNLVLSYSDRILALHENLDLVECIHSYALGERNRVAGQLRELDKQEKMAENVYVSQVFRYSGYILFSEKLSFQECFVWKMGIPYFIKWIKLLKSPVLQDNALLLVRDEEKWEEILKVLLENSNDLGKDDFRLLLIALKNRIYSISKELQNLDYTSNYKFYKEFDEIGDVCERAQMLYKDYLNDLGNKIFTILQHFFLMIKSNAEYVSEMILFICGCLKQQFHNEEILVSIDVSLQKILSLNSIDVSEVLQLVDKDNFTWSLLQNCQNGNKNNTLALLNEKFIEFFEKDEFFWNYSLEGFLFIEANEQKDLLMRAFGYTQLLVKLNISLEDFKNLLSKYLVVYEGWKYKIVPNWPFREIMREIYLLSVGGLISLTKYMKGEDELAKIFFDALFDFLICRMRNSTSMKSYSIPIQIFCRIKSLLWKDEIDNHCILLLEKVDSSEVLLESLISLLLDQDPIEVLGGKALSEITKRISLEFPILEMKYSSRKLQQKVTYYKCIKDSILDAIKID